MIDLDDAPKRGPSRPPSVERVNRGKGKRRPIQFWLRWLVIACILPAWAVVAMLVTTSYGRERRTLDQGTIVAARALMQSVDGEFARLLAAAQTLSTSPLLAAGDLEAFYRQARQVQEMQSATNIVLLQASGKQLLNTLVPFGTVLPATGNPGKLPLVFETGQPVISDLFNGPVANQPIMAVEIPVFHDGKIVYGLAIGILHDRFATILDRQSPPPGWVISILDSTGTAVARTHGPDQFLGKKAEPNLLAALAGATEGTFEGDTLEGTPVFAAFSRSSVSGWSVAIGIPRAALTADLHRSLWLSIAGAGALLLFGALSARAISNRIARSIWALHEPAIALASDLPLSVPEVDIVEVAEIGAVLDEAWRRRAQRTADREKEEAAERQIAIAERVAARFRALLDASPDAMIVVDPNGTINFVNGQAELVFGYSRLELIGQRVELLIPDGLRSDHQGHMSVLSAASQMRSVGVECLLLARRKDGSEFPVEVSLSPIEVDGVQLVMVRDVTEREIVEEQRRMIVESAPNGMLMIDASGLISLANAEVERIFGYEKGALIGLPIEALVPLAIDAPLVPDGAVIEPQGHALEGAAERQLTGHRQDGSTVPVGVLLNAIATPRGRIHLVSINDISSRLAVKQALRDAMTEVEAASRAKSEFLATMSHEIRTPMNAVIGLSHLALKTNLDAKQRNYLGTIHSSATALLGILNDLLDFSKIEAGKIELEIVDFDLGAVVSGIANGATLRAAEKGLELVVLIAPEVPLDLVGDPLRFGQILQNLLANAIKFTDHGEVVVMTRIVRWTDAGVELELSIRDTGIGIDDAQQARLFQPFTQADASTTRRFGGTGLGLAICKRLADLMDATIRVESEPAAGSTFTLRVPFRLQAGAEPRQQTMLPELYDRRVLIVDDNATVRHTFAAILSRAAMQVATVASGSESIVAIKRAIACGEAFDLVLMDWKMPGMDGIEAARIIRDDLAPETRPVIVMVTAYGLGEIVSRAEEAGVEAFLAKTTTNTLMLDTIASALAHRSLSVPADMSASAPSGAPCLVGIRILLTEDDAINQQVAAEILAGAGASIEIAENGKAAVECVLDNPTAFDVVLMDVQMPVMDGLEATRRIRREIPAAKLPILAMTAYAMQSDRALCRAAGMDDHIVKPIDPDALVATVARWVGRGQAESQSSQGTSSGEPQTASLAVSAPFDIAAGLARVTGNRLLLMRLIGRFALDFAHAGGEFRALLAAGNEVAMEHLAHRVAGVAATLQAGAVADTARRLEEALRKGGGPGVPHLVEQLVQALDQALIAAASLQPPSEETAAVAAPGTRPTTNAIDRAALAETIAQLHALLVKNSSRARVCSAELRQALAGTAFEGCAAGVAACLDSFDFRGAERKLDELASRLIEREGADEGGVADVGAR